MPSGGSSETPCHSSNEQTQPAHPHIQDTLHLPRGGVVAVDVDGRWSTICCRRTVAVFMVGVVDEEEGEKGRMAGPLEH